MAAQKYRFLNGPTRTRTITFDIAVETSGNARAHGRISAFGYGFTFQVVGSTLTVDGVNYTMPTAAVGGGYEGTCTISVQTKEVTELLGVGALYDVGVGERSVRGSAFTSTLTLGGTTIDRSGTVPSTGSATDGGWAGISPSYLCYGKIKCGPDSGSSYSFSGNDSGSLTITPTSIPFSAEEGAVSATASGTGSASNVAYPGDSYAWTWSNTEAAGYGISVSGDWTITRNGSPWSVLPAGFFWNNPSTFRYEAYAEARTNADLSAAYNLAAYAGSGLSTEPMEVQLLPKGDRVALTGSDSVPMLLRNRRRWAGGPLVTNLGSSSTQVTDHKSEQGKIEAKWKRVGAPDIQLARMGLRLWQWEALALSHDATTLVDDGSALTVTGGQFDGVWSATAGGSVSVVSGAVKLTGSAGKTLKRTFVDTSTTRMGWMQGYPCLRIKMRCSAAAHTITVEITEPSNGKILKEDGTGYEPKKWSVQTGAAATWTDIYLDLSSEHNGQPYSTWNNRQSGGGDAASFSAHFGGVVASLIELTGLGAGDYEIDELELLDRAVAPGASATNYVHLQAIPSGLLGQGICAGQGTVEITAPSTGGLITIPTRLSPTAGEIAAGQGLNRQPGWGMVDSSPRTGTVTVVSEPDPFLGGLNVLVYDTYSDRLCSDMPALWAGGQGYLHGAGGWSPLFDGGALDMTSPPVAIPAQWSVASFSWEWGEALDDLDDAFGFVAILPAGGVWGRMLQAPAAASVSAYRPAMSGNATATEIGGSGSDTEAIGAGSGFYALAGYGDEGLASSFPPKQWTITAAGSSQSPKPSRNMSIGTGRTRLVLVEGQAVGGDEGLDLAQSFSGRLARVWEESGTIWLELRQQAGGAWERKTTSITGSEPSVEYDTTSGALLLVYVSSGIKQRVSTDEGGAWAVATTISASGAHPRVIPTQSGVRHYFWYDSGAIKRRSYDAQMVEVIAVGSVVASGAADDSFDVRVLLSGSILLCYRNTSGAIINLVSTDNGVAFA